MPITILGPPWPTIHRLQDALTHSPVEGTYRMGGSSLDSITQLTCFREAGLLTPNFTTSLEEALRWVMEGRMVFGRQLHHTRGKDIVLPGVDWKLGRFQPNTPYPTSRLSLRWTNSEWWSTYIHPTSEWRVHVMDGKVIARGVKYPIGPHWRWAPVRNVGNGYAFRFGDPPPEGLRRVARRAVGALGYPAGAVDILHVAQTPPIAPEGARNEFYVLEVNRLPALTCPYTLQAWGRAIERHCKGV